MQEAVRFSIPSDVERLAPRLRDADVQEALASGVSSPLEALQLSYRWSKVCLTVVSEDDEPEMMMGVCATSDPMIGGIWLLSSDIITEKPLTFTKQAKRWLQFFYGLYPVLTNAVDARNEVHIKWLKMMGFHFINEVRPYGLPFYVFVGVSHVYPSGSRGPRD